MFTIVDLSNRIHDDAETNAPPVCEMAMAQTNTITKPLPHLVPPTSPSTSPSTSLSSSPSTSPSRSPSSSNYKIQTHRSDRFKLWWFFLQRQCDIWSRIKIFSSRITRLINWEWNVWGYWCRVHLHEYFLRPNNIRTHIVWFLIFFCINKANFSVRFGNWQLPVFWKGPVRCIFWYSRLKFDNNLNQLVRPPNNFGHQPHQTSTYSWLPSITNLVACI